MYEKQAVSVVLCTRDRPALLVAALEALARVVRDRDEVLVVDSASSNPRALAAARAQGFPVLRCERRGLSLARNAGVAGTNAPVVAFLDDDCLAHAGWTESIARPFDDAGVGFVTGRVVADRPNSLPVSVVDEATPRRFVSLNERDIPGTGANMAFR